MKVLYVEDNALDADLTQRELLRSAPEFELEIVATVAEAMSRMQAVEAAVEQGLPVPCDLVLLDMNLPDGNGLGVLTHVRHRNLPVAAVVLTGSGDEESVLAALRAGADDYVPKHTDYWGQLPAVLRTAHVRHQGRAVRQTRPLRLLYAEPNEADVHLTRLHLARHAPFIHLETVPSALQALDRLPASGPVTGFDVLLLDYRLPGMDALEALREIHQVRQLDVPVILITGHGTEEVALQAMKLGAADYLVKSPGYLFHLPSTVENAHHRAAAAREIAERRRAEERVRQLNRVYAVLSDINQTIVRVREPQELFAAACRIAHGKGGFCLAWVGQWEPESGLVNPVAQAGLDDGGLAWLQGLFRDGAGCEVTLEALRTGAPVVSNHFEQDARMTPWLEHTRRLGCHSMAALPLRQGESLAGIFNLYAVQPGFFDADEMRLLEELALDLGFALKVSQQELERRRAEEKIREQLHELQRWHEATLGREDRVLELKQEVNDLLAELGRPARYAQSTKP